jgi:TolB-like protein/Flp pilus assembly protein TadD
LIESEALRSKGPSLQGRLVTHAFQVTRIKVECFRDERFVKARTVNPKNFFAELKRRNVYKVAIAYAIVAWLLMQIATQVFPFLEIPNWAIRLVIMLIVIGFPIALIIAWAFELTPEGLKRTEFAHELPKKSPRSHVWIYVVVVAGAISVALFFFGRYSATSKQSGLTGLPAKSIAVLPFDNLSRDPDNAYFAEGVQDEILTRLAKVADLKVISRASTQRFKSAPDNLPVIAKQLGVTNILEGSVQKSNDQVRVNVQLINALTDANLWADIYDRKLTDIFKVESDIAKTIADTLQVKLTGTEKNAIAKAPTANNEAYELYLKGRFFWNKRTAIDLRKSIEYFNQAIEKDPKYSLAYAALAQSWVLLPAYNGGSPNDCFPQAEAAARKALALDDNSADAHAALGVVKSIYDFDFAGSIPEYDRAIQLNPNDATAHHWLANDSLSALGQSENEIAEMKRALELDPLSLIINVNLGAAYIHARRFDEAIAQLRKTVEMDGGFYYGRYNLALALELNGSTSEAIAEYQRAIASNDDPLPLALLGHLYARIGRRDEARQILEQLRERRRQRYVQAYCLAVVNLGLGDHNEAIYWLEEGYRERDGFAMGIIRIDPLLDSLRGDSRFEALVSAILSGSVK